MSKRGHFVVLEGIDGAGTTTQTALLADKLRGHGRPVRTTREPSDGPIGAMLRQILSGRLGTPGGGSPGWQTMALLFAADRMDHVESEIEPHVAAGGVVLSDRYDASSLAYQSAMSGREGAGALDWIRELNKHAPRPDLTLVLDVPAMVAAGRRESRGEAAQLYEQNEMQQALVAFYRELPKHMPDDRIVVLNGQGAIADVADRVFTAYRSVFSD